MRLFIITGASSGLGLDMAKLALSKGDHVIAISRRAVLKHERLISIKHDLSRPQGIDKKLDKAIADFNLKKIKSVLLINNAAGIEPVGHVGSLHEGILEQITLNLAAPIVLSNYVVGKFKKKAIITNISTGAAVRPINGWSLYCSSKCGLRMFSDCLSEEGVRSISFSPGIMDTSMQATIRKQKVKDFSRVKEFKEYKDKNMLLPSDKVANLLMDLLNSDKINKVHYTVNELM